MNSVSNPHIIISRLDKQIDNLISLRNLQPSKICDIDKLLNIMFMIKHMELSVEDKIRVLMMYNIQDSINELFANQPEKSSNPSLMRLQSDIVSNELVQIKQISDICVCGGTMSLQESHKICEKCGIVIAGFSDVMRSTRSREENITQHVIIWLDRIEGTESVKIADDEIGKIIAKIKQEYRMRSGRMRNITNISITEIREYLTNLHMNHYYKHIVKIWTLVMEKFNIYPEPVRFTPQEKEIIINKVNICYDAFKKIRLDRSLLDRLGVQQMSNLPYYPYIILRLLPSVILDSRLEAFKANIILQADETVYKNDMLWKLICETAGQDLTG